jgi:hypothetical protein
MGTRKHVFSFSYSTFRLTRSIPRTGFPSAPVGLQGQITGNRSLRLSWQLPSNTGTLVQVSSDIISFQVTRSLDANFSSSLVEVMVNNTANAVSFSFQDFDLEAGTRYYYRVQGRNLACSTANSCGDYSDLSIVAVGLF